MPDESGAGRPDRFVAEGDQSEDGATQRCRDPRVVVEGRVVLELVQQVLLRELLDLPLLRPDLVSAADENHLERSGEGVPRLVAAVDKRPEPLDDLREAVARQFDEVGHATPSNLLAQLVHTRELGDRRQVAKLAVVDLLGGLKRNATRREPRPIRLVPPENSEGLLTDPDDLGRLAVKKFDLDALESLVSPNEPLMVARGAANALKYPLAVRDEVRGAVISVEGLTGFTHSNHLQMR